MIRVLFIYVGAAFCCEDEANVDGQGFIDIGDLTLLITYLYITLGALDPCP